MRASKEDINAKFEWEGPDAIEWFSPDEVPEEIEGAWDRAQLARNAFDLAMTTIYLYLDTDDDEE